MSFSRGEVVLLPIPFTDLTSRKVRPAAGVLRVSTINSPDYQLPAHTRTHTFLLAKPSSVPLDFTAVSA